METASEERERGKKGERKNGREGGKNGEGKEERREG